MLSIGHRGAKGHYRDNSERSIRCASILDCDIIEIDVALTKDNIFVLWHDNFIRSFFMEEEREICDLLYKDLIGEDICTLNKGLGLMGDATAYLDLKIPESKRDDIEYIRKYGDLLLEYLKEDEEEMIILASFNRELMRYLSGKRERVNYFLGKIHLEDEEVMDDGMDIYVFDYRDKNIRNYVEKYRGEVVVFVYTVNEEEDIEEMREMGVNGVVSDYPEKVRK